MNRESAPLPPSGRGGLVGRLRARTAAHGSRLALANRPRSAGHYETLSYAELWREVDRAAAGLLQLGLVPGDRVGLVSENRPEWLVANLALQSLGLADVPRGGDAPASEVALCLGHSGARAAILEGPEQLSKLEGLSSRPQPLILLSGEAEGATSWSELLGAGERALRRTPDLVSSQREEVGPETISTVLYTSGTTGNPKGVVLTHGNILHNVEAVPDVLTLQPGMRFLSFLPSWHSFERTIEHIVLDSGMELHYASKRTLKDDLPRVRPHFLVAVPRVYEILVRRVLDAVHGRKGPMGALLRALVAGSLTHARLLRLARGQHVERDGRPTPPPPLARARAALRWPAHRLADLLVHGRLRGAFGGAVSAAISGGGPMPAYVEDFLVTAGLPLLNGYGLTETSPVLSVRRPGPQRLGTIGPPLPRTQIRIVDEEGRTLDPEHPGTIQARGPQVMREYWSNPTATAAALVGDGWFDTGDAGALTTRGELVISGRVKDTIVLSGGENIEPGPIEAEIVASPLVAMAMLVGHGQKTLGALLVPEEAAVRERLGLPEEVGHAELAGDERVHALLRDEVAAAISPRRGFRSYERVARFAVLDEPFTVENGALTATLKMRRHVIEERYRERIARLFGA